LRRTNSVAIGRKADMLRADWVGAITRRLNIRLQFSGFAAARLNFRRSS